MIISHIYKKYFFIPILIFASSFLLTNCANESKVTDVNFAPACPAVSVLNGASDMLMHDNLGKDIGHRIMAANIMSVQGDCDKSKPDNQKRPMTRVRITLDLRLERGPAAQSDHIAIPYFIAVLRDGQILDKKIFVAHFKTREEHPIEQVRTPLNFIDVPSGDNPHSTPYQLAVGFQLTQDQFNYNYTHMSPAYYIDTAADQAPPIH